MNLKQKLYTPHVAYAGIALVLVSVLLPPLVLFTDPGFVTSLLFGSIADRHAALQRLIVTSVVAAAGVVAGALGALVGKGPLSGTPSSSDASSGQAPGKDSK